MSNFDVTAYCRWLDTIDFGSSTHKARRLSQVIQERLQKPQGDGWDIPTPVTREGLLEWLWRNAHEAGMYCSPSWTRTFSDNAAAMLHYKADLEPHLTHVDAHSFGLLARVDDIFRSLQNTQHKV